MMAFDKNRTTTGMKIVIIIFCVILVLMLMLPSLSAVFSGNNAQEQNQPDVEQAVPQTVEEIDAIYIPAVDSLASRIETEPDNAALKESLGNAYFDWGLSLLSLSIQAQDVEQLDDLRAQAIEHFNSAIEQFDAYLENNSSNAVEIDRANAKFYAGDVDAAISDVEDFVAREEGYSPAWANLGQYYESLGDFDKAREYYNKALEVDPDDVNNVQAYVNARLGMLDAIEAAEASAAAAQESSENGTSTPPATEDNQ